MNNLEQAAELIENGWCTGQLRNGDGKHCSVGAILAVNGVSETELLHERLTNGTNGTTGTTDPYLFADGLPEIKALADEIRDSLSSFDKNLANADVVYFWNDQQEDVGSVLEMFKHAAKRLDG